MGQQQLLGLRQHTPTSGSSRVCQERARAIRSSTALLRSTITLPEFDSSAEFPRMGHHVAQLAVFISEPAKDISRQVREGVDGLDQLLLHQRRLTIHEAEDLWCWDWYRDSRLLGYRNTARVGEVFRKFFSEEQRRFFLRTALLAIHNPLLRVCQAGLLLTYFLLGEAQQLVGTRKLKLPLDLEQDSQFLCAVLHRLLPMGVGKANIHIQVDHQRTPLSQEQEGLWSLLSSVAGSAELGAGNRGTNIKGKHLADS
ncbi:hypothetical protein UY3_08924 [Chelonia mydas]|uniref:Maestro-like HEAT-repeats domain-containing protein n=1 Tax=Chelonia mydas TaxID=8469 RepID=M7BPI8_CHEMY|nr:hypothetical protein UY3_08924 [Chelonia mydas]